MTDDQAERYAEAVAPLRERFLADQYDLEQRAADQIASELHPLRGIIDSGYASGWGPTRLIEDRWLRWLDANLSTLRANYDRGVARIAKEVVSDMTGVVIDDSPEQSAQLAGILARLGVRILEIAESGPAGLEAIRRHQPSIATVDIQMPGLNGIDVVRAAVKASPKTRFVMCSGTSQKQVRDQARDAGASAFIAKPYDQILIARDLKALLV